MTTTKQNTDALVVSEVFGPTVQGEGPCTGERAIFLRLGLCNLECAWCDTPYTWDWHGANGKAYDRAEETTRDTFKAAWNALLAKGCGHLVITGGEPMVQRKALARFLEGKPHGWFIEMETNGTLLSDDPIWKTHIDQFNVSPKLQHAGMLRQRVIVPDVLRQFVDLGFTEGKYDPKPQVVFKFVCESIGDFDEVQAIVAECGIPDDWVWIMPQGRDAMTVEDGLQRLAEGAIERGWNVTGRLHVEVWGADRGH